MNSQNKLTSFGIQIGLEPDINKLPAYGGILSVATVYDKTTKAYINVFILNKDLGSASESKQPERVLNAVVLEAEHLPDQHVPDERESLDETIKKLMIDQEIFADKGKETLEKKGYKPVYIPRKSVGLYKNNNSFKAYFHIGVYGSFNELLSNLTNKAVCITYEPNWNKPNVFAEAMKEVRMSEMKLVEVLGNQCPLLNNIMEFGVRLFLTPSAEKLKLLQGTSVDSRIAVPYQEAEAWDKPLSGGPRDYVASLINHKLPLCMTIMDGMSTFKHLDQSGNKTASFAAVLAGDHNITQYLEYPQMMKEGAINISQGETDGQIYHFCFSSRRPNLGGFTDSGMKGQPQVEGVLKSIPANLKELMDGAKDLSTADERVEWADGNRIIKRSQVAGYDVIEITHRVKLSNIKNHLLEYSKKQEKQKALHNKNITKLEHEKEELKKKWDLLKEKEDNGSINKKELKKLNKGKDKLEQLDKRLKLAENEFTKAKDKLRDTDIWVKRLEMHNWMYNGSVYLVKEVN